MAFAVVDLVHGLSIDKPGDVSGERGLDVQQVDVHRWIALELSENMLHGMAGVGGTVDWNEHFQHGVCSLKLADPRTTRTAPRAV